MSSYEDKIEKILRDNKIAFRREVTFPDLHKKDSLRFDFGIYRSNLLLCLLEIDGEQHFKPIDFFGGRSAFMKCKAHDRFKNRYCLQHNIPLIRIPYFELPYISIEKIFTKESYRVLSEFHNDNLINK